MGQRVLSVRMPERLAEDLAIVARADGVSVAEFVRLAVADKVEARADATPA